MSTERDYSLLRPFDLEAAKRGEAICFNGDPTKVSYIAGPDKSGSIVCDVDGYFNEYFKTALRMAPLCWVEGRPVYRGDVLWHKPSGQKVNAHSPADSLHIFAEFEHDGLTTPAIAGLTWTPPKVKREGFVVVNKASVFNSREQAEAYRDSFLENTGRFVIGRAEWEEPPR